MQTEAPEQQSEHIVRSYEEQLKRLREMVARMGGLAERQVADAASALIRRDTELASAVVGRDGEIDALETEIENFCVRLLALRQPMAADLRLIVAAMKVSTDIERIGDYARNAAKRAIVVSQQPQLGSLNGFQWMAKLVQENLKDAIDALVKEDAAAAERVWGADAPVDDIYNGIFREMLTHMMEDPRNITAATHLLFIAKNFERIGDHATNIAETVHYAVLGHMLPEDRPKSDASAYTVVRPPA
ncbi:phosphate signaling complex protein PhoU [Pseudoroseomonas cervicalis]|uniref:Phosphate-specific transport system accessory protein PhoU n=1 Tax=Pseudoroseomonas cervicalis ATCC 49957 TaxID=525371 RepID=D5RQJ7_9PROT|nr:phosphate signaling complex protein PhoU [Pseudoroseomonas cervicalis]EFH10420.1 phosphate transport system regulatory protein PhoU [Pseudoroseomonas cervicalis ATCC 49957]WBV41722.1 phosphate signaling complex protein PhoU [Pseudoroseomonas cervicalis]